MSQPPKTQFYAHWKPLEIILSYNLVKTENQILEKIINKLLK